MSIDPSDDCTFWYANEYLPQNGLQLDLDRLLPAAGRLWDYRGWVPMS
jgi:hypothetical protein